jgi:hypothetical protein
MANLQNFDASAIMREISKFAPFALLLCAFGSFVAVGIFFVDYYENLLLVRFTESARYMAVMVAVIHEAVRFGLLIASIRDFTDKKAFNGWLGLMGSIALVYHDISVCKELAFLWNPTNPKPYSGLLVFMILVGLLLEVRLILTVGNENEKEQPQTKKQPLYSQNGVHQTV